MQMKRRQRNMIPRVSLHSQNQEMLERDKSAQNATQVLKTFITLVCTLVNSWDANDQLKIDNDNYKWVFFWSRTKLQQFASIYALLAFLSNDFGINCTLGTLTVYKVYV